MALSSEELYKLNREHRAKRDSIDPRDYMGRKEHMAQNLDGIQAVLDARLRENINRGRGGFYQKLYDKSSAHIAEQKDHWNKFYDKMYSKFGGANDSTTPVPPSTPDVPELPEPPPEPPAPPTPPTPTPPGNETDNSLTDNSIDDSFNTNINDSFNTDITNTSNIDNSTTTTIGDGNTFGDGANIGNNNSQSVVNQFGQYGQIDRPEYSFAKDKAQSWLRGAGLFFR